MYNSPCDTNRSEAPFYLPAEPLVESAKPRGVKIVLPILRTAKSTVTWEFEGPHVCAEAHELDAISAHDLVGGHASARELHHRTGGNVELCWQGVETEAGGGDGWRVGWPAGDILSLAIREKKDNTRPHGC